MSVKWTANRSESGILRKKSEFKEKKEELFVFGYSCKLFRDNEKALHIDQGKHLIPWMGDETLKIDRYDARGALHDLTSLEAPPGGFDWRVELTRGELDVEQLCDEERYRALHTDEDEEEMYKEEELKRLHAAGYGQVGFNYDTPQEAETTAQPMEIDEPFLAAPSLMALLPPDMILPEGQKQNAIIEKTAKFIASQGAQMEILIKAKQQDNTQFQFLNKDSPLNAYYSALIGLVKAEKWPEKIPEIVEEKPPENEEYLHPSLASTIIESAPSIPSIHYKPSADCDYTMLICKMRGDATMDESLELAPGEEPPPGTEPVPLRTPREPPRPPADITRAPVMYNLNNTQPNLNGTVPSAPPPSARPVGPRPAPAAPVSSTGLSLMSNYNTDSDSDATPDEYDSSSSDSKDAIPIPPDDVQVVIDKMAAYVARNGDEFAEIVRAKNDPRFTFLEPDNQFHAYYRRLMQQKRGIDVNGKGKESKRKTSAPVSFSIKKLKEPDPILPKPALPYESSSEDEETSEKVEEPKETPKQPQLPNVVPPVIVYKIENHVPETTIVKPAEPVHIVSMPVPEIKEVKEIPKEVKIVEPEVTPIEPKVEVRAKSLTPEQKQERKQERYRERDSPKREKRKHKEKKKEYRSKSESRESKRPERSEDRERRREKEFEREKRRRVPSRDELETEIISLVDTTDDLIDLTGDQPDCKVEIESEAEKAKKEERRRRAAAFLKRAGVDPAAAALPTTSLASAMVDTLESIRKRKEEEDEKRRKREKRRHRDRYEYEDGSHRKSKRRKHKSSDENEDSDFDGSKKKKRKKEKKHTAKSKRKRRREPSPALGIDLSSTLRGLRAASPPPPPPPPDMDMPTKERKSKKEDREYSEGEWSSDSEVDSTSSVEANVA